MEPYVIAKGLTRLGCRCVQCLFIWILFSCDNLGRHLDQRLSSYTTHRWWWWWWCGRWWWWWHRCGYRRCNCRFWKRKILIEILIIQNATHPFVVHLESAVLQTNLKHFLWRHDLQSNRYLNIIACIWWAEQWMMRWFTSDVPGSVLTTAIVTGILPGTVSNAVNGKTIIFSTNCHSNTPGRQVETRKRNAFRFDEQNNTFRKWSYNFIFIFNLDGWTTGKRLFIAI